MVDQVEKEKPSLTGQSTGKVFNMLVTNLNKSFLGLAKIVTDKKHKKVKISRTIN